MLVAEFMQKPTLLISLDDSIRTTIVKLLSLGASGALVHKDNIIVGAISESDILSQLYPSQQEFMDKSYQRDFEDMETNMKRILSKKVKDLMRTNIEDALVYPTSSLIHVLSVMSTYGFSHLAVINQRREIVGMIHQRDIFKSLIGSETPYATSFDYHDWTARFYDMVHTSSNRYNAEVKSLINLFTKKKVKTILDIGYGTGTHAVELAQAGFNVVGIERSKTPYRVAQQKKSKLPENVQNRLEFLYTEDFAGFLEKSAGSYDAVMIMGNILAQYNDDWADIVKSAGKALASSGLMIIQSTNSHRILKRRNGLLSSTMAPSKLTIHREYSFTLFYDRPWKDDAHVLLTMSVLRYDGMRWMKESINSVKLLDFKPKQIESAMKSGISSKDGLKIELFGSSFGEGLFDAEFHIEGNDWFTYVMGSGPAVKK